MPADHIESGRSADRYRLPELQLARASQGDPVRGSQQGLINRLAVDLHLAHRLQKVALGVALNRRMVPGHVGDQGDIDRRLDLRLPQGHAMAQARQVTADAVNPQSVGSELVVQVRDRRSGRFVGHGYPSERKKPQGAAKDVRGIAVVPSYYIATPAILLAHREGEAPAEPPKRQAFGAGSRL